jgi:hypothetical protein
MMIYPFADKITDTLTYEEFLKFSDFLLAFSLQVNDNKSFESLYNHFKNAYLEIENHAPYRILKGTQFILVYLMNNWILRDSMEMNRENLRQIRNRIYSDFSSRAGTVISEEQIYKMIALVNDQFSYMSLGENSSIDIVIVDFTFNSGNSAYFINLEPAVTQKDFIALTHVTDLKAQPEFVFLHELGHLLHTRACFETIKITKQEWRQA